MCCAALCVPQALQDAEVRAKEEASRAAAEATKAAEAKERQERLARLREWDAEEVGVCVEGARARGGVANQQARGASKRAGQASISASRGPLLVAPQPPGPPAFLSWPAPARWPLGAQLHAVMHRLTEPTHCEACRPRPLFPPAPPQVRLLRKAMDKFPPGTSKRWEQVQAYVRTRTVEEVRGPG